MKESEKTTSAVARQALSWIAWLFCVSEKTLIKSKRIGLDLKPAVGSFYGLKSVDIVVEDIIVSVRSFAP